MSTPQERFTTLFDRTHPHLLAYAVRRVWDPADAADVVAETFLVAWRRLDDVPEGDHARPWLFGVARRVLANHFRGERRRTALGDRLREALPSVAPATDREPTTVELALARLSSDDQELLRLVAWEGLARDEIALALGVPRATVRVRLHRARQRLSTQMTLLESEGSVPATQVLGAPRSAGAPRRTPVGAAQLMDGRATTRLRTEEGR